MDTNINLLEILTSPLPAFELIIVGTLLFILYRYLTMTTNPFQAMQALYVYLAAFFGLALVAFGLYGLIEQMFGVLLAGDFFYLGTLVTPLTQIIVGAFIMVPHWAIGHHFYLLGSKKKD